MVFLFNFRKSICILKQPNFTIQHSDQSIPTIQPLPNKIKNIFLKKNLIKEDQSMTILINKIIKRLMTNNFNLTKF